MPDDEEINLDTVPKAEAFYRKSPTFEKEKGASWVARALVCIFGGALLICLVGGLVVIAVHPPANGAAGSKENIIGVAVLPLLEGVGIFASTVFSPLLAFILGYYFGEKKQGG
jgi:hypothetical protein